MKGGYIVTARSIFEHEDFEGETFSRREAFLWLVAQAAWKDTAELKRGQVEASLRKMATTWGWTIDKVRWALKGWQAKTMVKIHTTGHTTGHPTPSLVVTLCNYDKYQKVTKGNTTGHTTGHTTVEKKKKPIEEKKKENIVRLVATQPDDRFEEFWNGFPKRLGDNPKHKAHLKFLELTRSGVDPALMIAAARRSPAHANRGDDRKYVPMCITWLNQHRWEDDARSGLFEEAPMSETERDQLIARLRSKP